MHNSPWGRLLKSMSPEFGKKTRHRQSPVCVLIELKEPLNPHQMLWESLPHPPSCFWARVQSQVDSVLMKDGTFISHSNFSKNWIERCFEQDIGTPLPVVGRVVDFDVRHSYVVKDQQWRTSVLATLILIVSCSISLNPQMLSVNTKIWRWV
jgi:hypothetical protein